MMIAATSAASAVNQRGETSAFIFLRSAVNITSGTTENGKASPSTTWLRIRSLAVPASPYQIVTIAAGTMASARVVSRRAQAGKRMSMKPSITIWPDNVAVTVEFIPQHKSAIPNSVGAIAEPSNGAKNACEIGRASCRERDERSVDDVKV